MLYNKRGIIKATVEDFDSCVNKTTKQREREREREREIRNCSKYLKIIFLTKYEFSQKN